MSRYPRGVYGYVVNTMGDEADTVRAVTPYEQLFRLDGRTALVVGAGSGIGAAVAEGLAAFGAAVICADSRPDAARSTADGIGSSASAFELDLTDGTAVEAASRDLGPPDILVTTPSVNVRKRIVDYTDDDLDRVVDLNIKGTFRLCRAFGSVMAAAGRGSMIGFSSIRSQTTEPGQGAYAATKAATIMLFKTLGGRARTVRRAGEHRRPRRRRDATHRADQGPAGVARRLRRQDDPATLGRSPPRWSVPWSTLHRMRAATSPARRSSSTVAGPPPTAASNRLMRPAS